MGPDECVIYFRGGNRGAFIIVDTLPITESSAIEALSDYDKYMVLQEADYDFENEFPFDFSEKEVHKSLRNKHFSMAHYRGKMLYRKHKKPHLNRKVIH